jgi:hypothetical protein
VPDPWEVLGLSPGAPLSEARAARRRLAKELHPDAHAGRDPAARAALERRMVSVNQALAAIVAASAASSRAPARRDAPAAPPGRTRPRAPADEGRGHEAGEDTDVATLGLDVLPVRAFEAVFLAAYALGEVLDDDEPYRLDVFLRAPRPCFCRFDIVPDAGGSTVALSLSPADDDVMPSVASVRDLLVAELEALGMR